MDNTQSFNDYLSQVMTILLRISLIAVFLIASVLIIGFALPYLMPNLTNTLLKADNVLFWYLSRGSAIIGYVLLWLSTVMGLLVTTRVGKTWPGMKISSELHQYVSILGLFFIGFHGVLLLGDAYMKPTLTQLLTPFAFLGYRPINVGIGQLVFYMWVILIISFYIKKITGRKIWRGLHYIGFVAFFAGMVHGITSGTDSTLPWMQLIYWFSAASALFLTAYRIMMRTDPAKQQPGIERTQINSKVLSV
jgi:predicted ferric reductase